MIPFSEDLHYLDPGTGSYLFQALLAAGITVGIYFKNLKWSLPKNKTISSIHSIGDIIFVKKEFLKPIKYSF